MPLRDLVLYAGPIFGLTTTLFFVQFYFLKFAADVLLIAPGVVGAVFALGRVWDAISDPLVGRLSDRTHTRLGRRRPWMLAGIPVLATAFAMTWIPPRGLEGVALTAWITVVPAAPYRKLKPYASTAADNAPRKKYFTEDSHARASSRLRTLA